MGDYDYLNPRMPPGPFDDTDADTGNTVESVDPDNAAVDNAAAPQSITTQIQFPDGATRAVTHYPDVPHPLGGSGPAIMIHATPLSQPQQQQAPSLFDDITGNGQIVTGQNAQSTDASPAGASAMPALSNPPPANIYGTPATAGYVTGTAPDPGDYAAKGEIWRGLMSNPDGAAAGDATIAYLGSLLNFRRGGPLDAQVYGGDRGYGNYTFGVYNAAAGSSLQDTLAGANQYGRTAHYDPQKIKMDPVYKNIPQSNVQNITRGYNDYVNGTLWHKPK